MDLKQLQEKGAFVPPTPIVKEVSWTHRPVDEHGLPVEGSENTTDTFTVHVKKLSFGAIEQLLSPDNKQSERAKMSAFISAAIVLDGGKPFPFAKAYELDPGFATALMNAINDVNGTGTPPATTNGANGAATDEEPVKN